MGTRTTPATVAQEKSPPPDNDNNGCNDKSMVGVQQLLIDLQRLSEDPESADLVFVVDRDEERVYAHKIILMARYSARNTNYMPPCVIFNSYSILNSIFRCKNFQTTKRGEFCRISGSLVSPSTPGSPTHIRLPHVNVGVFRQFILYAYTGKVSQAKRILHILSTIFFNNNSQIENVFLFLIYNFHALVAIARFTCIRDDDIGARRWSRRIENGLRRSRNFDAVGD